MKQDSTLFWFWKQTLFSFFRAFSLYFDRDYSLKQPRPTRTVAPQLVHYFSWSSLKISYQSDIWAGLPPLMTHDAKLAAVWEFILLWRSRWPDTRFWHRIEPKHGWEFCHQAFHSTNTECRMQRKPLVTLWITRSRSDQMGLSSWSLPSILTD